MGSAFRVLFFILTYQKLTIRPRLATPLTSYWLYPNLFLYLVQMIPINAIKWSRGLKWPPWRLITVVREIKALWSGKEISFALVKRTANGVANFFTKNIMDSPILGVFYLLAKDRKQGTTVFYFTVIWLPYWMYFSFIYSFSLGLSLLDPFLCTCTLLFPFIH